MKKIFLFVLFLSMMACSFLTQEKSISVEVRDQEIEIDVAADQGWQDTGFGLKSGEQVLIEYLAGQIKDNAEEISDGTGTNYICGNSGCCEPMVAARRSSLIGRIGRIDDGIFYIGNGVEITSEREGNLFLRINDCNEGLYDNEGTLKVRITRK